MESFLNALKSHAAALDGMAGQARARGARFLVVIFPIFHRVGGAGYPLKAVHADLVRSLAARGVDALDLQPAYAGRADEELWVDPADQHPNDVAHAIAAEQVRQWLVQHDALPGCR